MSKAFNLYRLQRVDSQIDQIQESIVKIKAVLSDNTRLNNAHAQAEVTHEKLQRATKEIKMTEQATLAQQIKIEQAESNLYSGRILNPKELQDQQNEVFALKRYLSVLEERQIEAMIESENAETDYNRDFARLRAVENEVSSQRTDLAKELSRLQSDLNLLEKKRVANLGNVPEDDLQKYNKIRNRLKGVAVAKVIGSSCDACGSTLSAALSQAARSPNHLNTCETCGRILYG